MVVSIFKSKVLSIEDLTEDVKLVKLSVPKDFEFKAGQYLSLSVFDKTGKKFRRPLSIASSTQNKGYIEFCTKIIPGGLASGFIKKLKKGDEIELLGPAGKFYLNNFNKDLFFIAAGVGIAPFVSIICDLLEKDFKKKIILLKSSRTESGSLYDKRFEELSKKYGNFEFHNVYSKPKNPKDKNVGHVQDFLQKYLPENPKEFNGNFYICGLKEMISETEEKLKDLGFREEQIFYEKFD